MALAQLELIMEGQEPRVQVARARQPLGVVAIILCLLEGLGVSSLVHLAACFLHSLLATLAVDGLRRVAKVLVEFRSDFLVAQELPAGGRRVLLVPVGSGLL